MRTLTTRQVVEILRALEGVTDKDHFGSDAFRAGKRNFATIWHDQNEVNVRLEPGDHAAYLEEGGEAFEEIPNAWGRQGWLKIRLEFADRALVTRALDAAWKLAVATAKPKAKP